MEKRALIILSGARVIPKKKDGNVVICADSGYLQALEASIDVDHLVGDMDSLPQDHLKEAVDSGISVQVHPRDKDLSDGEIALRLALDMGYEKITITGGKGGRIDHVLSTFYLPFLSENRIDLEIWIDKDQVLILEEGKKVHFQKSWKVVSLIPINSSCVVTTSGLKWPLTSARLEMGTTRGIHNEPITIPFSIKCEEGSLWVILTDEE
jgi:thiamine pyrophosphokinase